MRLIRMAASAARVEFPLVSVLINIRTSPRWPSGWRGFLLLGVGDFGEKQAIPAFPSAPCAQRSEGRRAAHGARTVLLIRWSQVRILYVLPVTPHE
jgi:hypothetical protein